MTCLQMAVVRPAIAVAPLPVGVLVPGQSRHQTTYDDLAIPRPAEFSGETVYTWIDDTTVDWDPSLFPKRRRTLSLLNSLAVARSMGIRIFHELQETADRTAYLATLNPLETLVAKNIIRYEDELRRVREITGDPQYQLSLKFLPLLVKLKPGPFGLFSDILEALEDRSRAVRGPKPRRIQPVGLYDMVHVPAPPSATEFEGAGAGPAAGQEEEEDEHVPLPADFRPALPVYSRRGRKRRKEGIPEARGSSSFSSSNTEDEEDEPPLHQTKKARYKGKMPLK